MAARRARAAGVSELFAQAYTPTKTPNTQRLEKWSKLAEEQRAQQAQQRPTRLAAKIMAHRARQSHQAPAPMRPPSRLQVGAS